MNRICRTCRDIIEPGEQFYNLDGELNDESEQIKSQLESVVPQITLNIVQNAVICICCVDTLNNAYNFKLKCIQTEEKIYEYILRTDDPNSSVDINLVLKDEEKNSGDDSEHMENCKIEVIKEELPSLPFEVPEDFSANTISGTKYKFVESIKIENPDLTDAAYDSLSDGVGYCRSSTVPGVITAGCFYGFENSELATSTAYVEHFHSFGETCSSENDARANGNNENIKDKQGQLPVIQPRSVALTYIADEIRESLKQRSKLICAMQPQQNSQVDICSPNTSKIQKVSRIDFTNNDVVESSNKVFSNRRSLPTRSTTSHRKSYTSRKSRRRTRYSSKGKSLYHEKSDESATVLNSSSYEKKKKKILYEKLENNSKVIKAYREKEHCDKTEDKIELHSKCGPREALHTKVHSDQPENKLNKKSSKLKKAHNTKEHRNTFENMTEINSNSIELQKDHITGECCNQFENIITSSILHESKDVHTIKSRFNSELHTNSRRVQEVCNTKECRVIPENMTEININSIDLQKDHITGECCNQSENKIASGILHESKEAHTTKSRSNSELHTNSRKLQEVCNTTNAHTTKSHYNSELHTNSRILLEVCNTKECRVIPENVTEININSIDLQKDHIRGECCNQSENKIASGNLHESKEAHTTKSCSNSELHTNSRKLQEVCNTKECRVIPENMTEINVNSIDLQKDHIRGECCNQSENKIASGNLHESKEAHTTKSRSNSELHTNSRKLQEVCNTNNAHTTKSRYNSELHTNSRILLEVCNTKECRVLPENMTEININSIELQIDHITEECCNQSENIIASGILHESKEAHATKSRTNSKLHTTSRKLQEVYNRKECREIPKNVTEINSNSVELQKDHITEECCNESGNKITSSTLRESKGTHTSQASSVSKNRTELNNSNSSKLQKAHNSKEYHDTSESKTEVNRNSIGLYKPKETYNRKACFKQSHNTKEYRDISKSKSKVNRKSIELQKDHITEECCNKSGNKITSSTLRESKGTHTTQASSNVFENRIELNNSNSRKLKEAHNSKEYHDTSESKTEVNRNSIELHKPKETYKRKACFNKSHNTKEYRDTSGSKTKVNRNSLEFHKAKETYKRKSCFNKFHNTKEYHDTSGSKTEVNRNSTEFHKPKETYKRKAYFNTSHNNIELNSKSSKLQKAHNTKKYCDTSECKTAVNRASIELQKSKITREYCNKSENNTTSNYNLHKPKETYKKNACFNTSDKNTELNSICSELQKAHSSKEYHDTSQRKTRVNRNSIQLQKSNIAREYCNKSENKTASNNNTCQPKDAHNTNTKLNRDLSKVHNAKAHIGRNGTKEHRDASKPNSDISSNSCELQKDHKTNKYCNKSENNNTLNTDLLHEFNTTHNKKENHHKPAGKPEDKTELNSNFCKRKKAYTEDGCFCCEKCDYSTKRKSSLESQLNMHRIKEFFECDLCSYTTGILSHWHQHLLTHDDNKPFKCRYCKYRTTLKTNLLRHRLIHTGEKPYRCKLCEFRSAWKQSLQLHVRTLHS